MARPKPHFVPEPRMLNEYQTAARLGKGQEWFRSHRPRLEALGFPKRDAVLDGWDGAAIEAWLDNRSGIGTKMDGDNPWNRISHGKRHAAIS